MINRRNTKQRQLILDSVKSRCDHPTAEQIYQDVYAKDRKVSRGTVYRNLSVLATQKQIKEIPLSDANRYDLRTDNHIHFICEKCHKVFDIPVSYDESLDNKRLENGFLINNHETIFKGLCSDCADTLEEK